MAAARRGQQAPAFASILEAIQVQQFEVAMDMLDEGCSFDDKDGDGNAALHWAATLPGAEALVERLLQAGARQDLANAGGETAAHWAAKTGNISAMRILMEADHSVALFARDGDGFTPFLACVQVNGTPMLEWLYLQGASIEERDSQGRTPLMWATYKGHRRTVQWLLSRGASIAARDDDGMTALHWAAVRDQDAIAKMLLDVGAGPLLRAADRCGDSPVLLAWRKGHVLLFLSFVKSVVLIQLCGRPRLVGNVLALAFVALAVCNTVLYAAVIAPRVWNSYPVLAAAWPGLMLASCLMWLWGCLGDPGWAHPRSILSQTSAIAKQEELGLLAAWQQPAAEQAASALRTDHLLQRCAKEDTFDREVTETTDGSASGTPRGAALLPPGAALARLRRLEEQQLLIAHQQQLIAAACRALEEAPPTHRPLLGTVSLVGGKMELQPLMAAGDIEVELRPGAGAAAVSEVVPRAGRLLGRHGGEAQEEPPEMQLRRAGERLPALARRVAELLAEARRGELVRSGRTDYSNCVQDGNFRDLCLICHSKRGFRCFHCKDCGRCVHRLDHHCPWMDNCVGIANQRLFYMFLLALFGALATLLWLGYISLSEVLTSRQTVAGWSVTFLELTSLALDVAWLYFVGSLLLRQTTYMLVNLTTYEVLLSPPHVHQRFPTRSGRFWFLSQLGLRSGMRSCAGYWARDTSRDHADFGLEDGSWDVDVEANFPSPPEESPLCGCCAPGAEGWSELCCDTSAAAGHSRDAYTKYVPGSLQSSAFPSTQSVEGTSSAPSRRSRELLLPHGEDLRGEHDLA